MPAAMAMPMTKTRIVPRSEERRRHQRVKVNLLGRYMLSDRREFPCQVIDMSPGGMAVVAPVAGNPGERVIAYVDHLGRLEGKIARLLDNGFAMTISATSRKRDKLAAQLTWLANRQILNLPEDRRHGRFTPRNALSRLILRTAPMSPAASSTCPPRVPRSRSLPTCCRRQAPPSPSAKRPAGWSVTSKTASPSNSPACSIPIPSKTTSPANSVTAP